MGPGELGIQKDELPAPVVEPSAPSSVIPTLSQTSAAAPQMPLKGSAENANDASKHPGQHRTSSSIPSWPPSETINKETVTATPASSPAKDDSASRLRQRLKAAVLGTGTGDHS